MAVKKKSAKQKVTKKPNARRPAPPRPPPKPAPRPAAKTKATWSDAELREKALALPAREVKPLGFAPAVAKRAALTGLDAIKSGRAALAPCAPLIDLAQLDALPRLADLVADEQHAIFKAQPVGTLEALLPEAQAWRRKLLNVARSLAEEGALDADDVAAIERGTGAADNVRDVEDLVELLTPYRAAVEALHKAGALERAVASAAEAKGAVGSSAVDGRGDAASRALRDRYATLYVQGHDRLRTAAALLFGMQAALTKVPGYIAGAPKKKDDEPEGSGGGGTPSP